ncbi:N-acetyltransferase [Cryobacterium sp. TMT1-19]|uniref:GNAT family N-acetyltransferase n=1 Tax=Cryobacterium sp. TMT1-19 TaxID=1259231 RepID=UPI001069335F|nr:GNAT family N-acetyltransferase [Cryobacterium sp. TMT1-19]TFD38707.1 N-acetyltransferase [Cryobacterium sp. TMT1-19]
MQKCRQWDESDTGHLLRAFGANDDLATQVGDTDLSTLERCQEFIALQLAPSSPSVRNFAISVDGKAVGNVGIGNMEHRHDTGRVYYWVSAEARGQGLASRSLASATAGHLKGATCSGSSSSTGSTTRRPASSH